MLWMKGYAFWNRRIAFVYWVTVGALRGNLCEVSNAMSSCWCAARAWLVQLMRLFLSAMRPGFITSHGVTKRAMVVFSGANRGSTKVAARWSEMPSFQRALASAAGAAARREARTRDE